MIPARTTAESLWWLVHKDLTRELRARSVWPGMLLLGLVLVFMLATQIDLPMEQKGRVVGGLLWVAVFFAGTLTLDRSFANERKDGCWQSLTLYPIAPSVLFLAKMVVNVTSLVILETLLIPLFIVMTDVPLLAQPEAIALVALLSNIGFAAVGTLVSAVTTDLRNRGGLIALLLLPMAVPVVFGCAEATSITLAGEIDESWWQWIQLLSVFAIVFTVVGALAFEFVLEESSHD
jgi:heme exporter protein B